jgi:dihydrofolate reductase
MKKLGILMHISLDGFVAGPNGEITWIKIDEELFDYVGTIVSQADTAIYGRVTYQMMEAYWPTAADRPGATKHDIEHARWYASVSKIVLSRTIPQTVQGNTKILGEDVVEEIKKVKQGYGNNILILGSPTVVHTLTEEHLIDEYWLFVNPIVLGHGISLFADLEKMMPLRLLSTKVFASGVIALQYERSSNN